MQPFEGFRGTFQTGSCTSLGSWAKLAVHGCGSSATHGGGYLATPITFAYSSSEATHNISCSLAAACGFSCSSEATVAYSCIACGHSCGLQASSRCSCSFLAAPSPNSSCGYPAAPSYLCNQSATRGHPCGHLTLSPI